MTPVLSDIEFNRLSIFGQGSGVDDEVCLRSRLVALPEADIVVDQVDPGGARFDLVGPDYFVKMQADFGGGIRHREMDDRRVFFKAAPVALVGKGFAARDAHCGENAPAADDSGLARREADFFDRVQTVVMKNVAMNHANRPLRPEPGETLLSIVPEIVCLPG